MKPGYLTGKAAKGEKQPQPGTCTACGALVLDREQHDQFHALLDLWALSSGASVGLTARLLEGSK